MGWRGSVGSVVRGFVRAVRTRARPGGRLPSASTGRGRSSSLLPVLPSSLARTFSAFSVRFAHPPIGIRSLALRSRLFAFSRFSRTSRVPPIIAMRLLVFCGPPLFGRERGRTEVRPTVWRGEAGGGGVCWALPYPPACRGRDRFGCAQGRPSGGERAQPASQGMTTAPYPPACRRRDPFGCAQGRPSGGERPQDDTWAEVSRMRVMTSAVHSTPSSRRARRAAPAAGGRAGRRG
jgi:hypothetical protein